MLTTDQEALASAALRIEILLNEGFLTEDPVNGTVQMHPEMYTYMGKHSPFTLGNRPKQRAEKLVTAYQKIWPAGVSSGGRPVRQGPSALTKKLTVYLGKHPKTTDAEILSAAERYVATKKKENYSFITCSDYFIEKGGSSVLEAYISNPNLGADKLEPTKAINQRFV